MLQCDLHLLGQSELCEADKKPSVPCQVKVHRGQVPLYQGYGAERSSEALVRGNRGVDRRCDDKDSCES